MKPAGGDLSEEGLEATHPGLFWGEEGKGRVAQRSCDQHLCNTVVDPNLCSQFLLPNRLICNICPSGPPLLYGDSLPGSVLPLTPFSSLPLRRNPFGEGEGNFVILDGAGVWGRGQEKPQTCRGRTIVDLPFNLGLEETLK